MGTEKPVISQKEYLKRYLGKDKTKKKKKPKISSSSLIKRSVIIDDDLGLKDNANVDDEEFNLDYLGDEAPQIVGIVDERPPELRAKEKYDNNLWRTIGEKIEDQPKEKGDSDHSLSRTENKRFKDDDDNKKLKNGNHQIKKNEEGNNSDDSYLSPKGKRAEQNNSDSDMSPPRHSKRSKSNYQKQSYLKKHCKKSDSDSDMSSPRQSKSSKSSYQKKSYLKERDKKNDSHSDMSPPRKTKSSKSNYHNENHLEERVKKYNSDSDMSPPRHSKRSKSNYQKERYLKERCKKSDSDSDMSPPRQSKSSKSSYQKESYLEERDKKRDSDSDMSPPRKTKSSKSNYYKGNNMKESLIDRNKDKSKKDSHRYIDRNKRDHLVQGSGSESPSSQMKRRYKDEYRRKNEREYKRNYEDSKSRRNSHDYDKPPSRQRFDEKSRIYREHASVEHSNKKPKFHREQDEKSIKSKRDDDADLSPLRNSSTSHKNIEKSISRSEREEKMLDGKKSGLQDAKHLKEELKKLKENEDKLFKKLDPTALGANAAPIKRNRKTGQIRNIEKEEAEEKAKTEKRAKTESQYYKWGKGLKQMQEQENRIADAIHEMSKPLARYRDDKDLDAYLRAQEREGDPMLDYIKNKMAESHNVIDLTVGSIKPKYKGSFMPNRFGIAPGYRWDGVDRSNSYEKKWFEQRNSRKAVEEEAYKWSTSDM